MLSHCLNINQNEAAKRLKLHHYLCTECMAQMQHYMLLRTVFCRYLPSIESFLPNDLIITSGARGRRFFYVTKPGKSKTTRCWLSFVFLSTVRICRFFNREDYNGFQ